MLCVLLILFPADLNANPISTEEMPFGLVRPDGQSGISGFESRKNVLGISEIRLVGLPVRGE
jgi:hypothetical protein